MNNQRSPSIRLLVHGPRACFRRPECVNDFVSYDAMPPTVVMRLLSALDARIGSDWQPLSIHVLRPVEFGWDEVSTARGRRRVLHLVNVAYVIEATSILHDAETWAPSKTKINQAIHLGLMDYPGSIRLLAVDDHPVSALAGTGMIDLGWMLYRTAAGKRDQFFRAVLKNGILDLDAADQQLVS